MENSGAVLQITRDLQERMLELERGQRDVLQQQGENAGVLKGIESSVKSLVESTKDARERQETKELEQDERLSELEEAHQQRKGFVSALSVVWGVVGVGVGAGIKAAVQKNIGGK